MIDVGSRIPLRFLVSDRFRVGCKNNGTTHFAYMLESSWRDQKSAAGNGLQSEKSVVHAGGMNREPEIGRRAKA